MCFLLGVLGQSREFKHTLLNFIFKNICAFQELEMRTKYRSANVTSSAWNPLTLNQRSISVDY